MKKERNMMYIQNITHFPFKNMAACMTHIKKVIKPKRCAGIIHDKDVYTKEEQLDWEKQYETPFPHMIGEKKADHVHVMMQFENPRSLENIAKLLGDQPQTIQKWQGNYKNGFAYLIHATTNANNQYPYPPEEVLANFDFEEMMLEIQESIKQNTKSTIVKDELIIRACLDQLKTGDITLREVEDLLTGYQYAKAKNRIENVWLKRRKDLSENWRKEMIDTGKAIDVIYIYGQAGTGKTRLAKEYAKKNKNGYFLTGSSRDPFQLYQGEQTIILDELRPSTFPYNDLLKLLDPFNTRSNAPSRYFDKLLTADLIIITSPYSPKEFYQRIMKSDKHFDERIDSYYQLARRLGLVMFVTKDFMQVAFFDECRQDFTLDKSSKETNPYKEDTINNILSQNQKAEKLYKNILDAFRITDSQKDYETSLNEQTKLFETHTKLEIKKKIVKTDNKKSPIIKPTKANNDETKNVDI
ncbi:TPA: Rep family protein [Enterococcus faecalis]